MASAYPFMYLGYDIGGLIKIDTFEKRRGVTSLVQFVFDQRKVAGCPFKLISFFGAGKERTVL